jgi:hypothetical protein
MKFEPFFALFREDPVNGNVNNPPQASSPVPQTAGTAVSLSIRRRSRRNIRPTRRSRAIRKWRQGVHNPLDDVLKDCSPVDKPQVRYLSGKGIFGSVRQATLSNLPEASNHIERLQRKQMTRIGADLRKSWCQLQQMTMHIFIRKSIVRDENSADSAFLLKQMDFSSLQLNAVSAK